MQYLFVLVNKFQIDLHSNMKKKIFVNFLKKKVMVPLTKNEKIGQKLFFQKQLLSDMVF